MIKVAVIGGMIETGFWQALAERYEAARGNKIEVVATGPKPQVVAAFRKGGRSHHGPRVRIASSNNSPRRRARPSGTRQIGAHGR